MKAVDSASATAAGEAPSREPRGTPTQTAAPGATALPTRGSRMWSPLVVPEALQACRAAGVVPVTGLCPFMALPDAGWFHGLHRLFRREARATEEITA